MPDNKKKMKATKRVASKPKMKADMPDKKGFAKKDNDKDKAMMGKPEPKKSETKPQPESKKEEKKTKKTRSERITARADKKWDKDKELRRKQTEAIDEGKDNAPRQAPFICEL